MIDVTTLQDGSFQIFVTEGSAEVFKQLVHRATNTWDNAPPEIKEFSDLITHGKVLQDYRAQYAHKPLQVPTAAEFFEKQAATVEELAICLECKGHGYLHLHTCPRLGKNG